MGPPGYAAVAGVQGLLAQQLGDVFVGGLLISTQIDQCVGVAQQALPIVFEQGLEGGDVLQDYGGHDVAGAHGSLQLSKIVRQGHVAELVHHQTDRDRQSPLVYFVGLVVEGLKGAGIEHTHQIRKCGIVVRDDGEYRLLALSHSLQLHVIPGRNAGDLGQDEGGEPDSGGDQNRFGRLARNELSRTF